MKTTVTIMMTHNSTTHDERVSVYHNNDEGYFNDNGG